jgi:hypothetical protein
MQAGDGEAAQKTLSLQFLTVTYGFLPAAGDGEAAKKTLSRSLAYVRIRGAGSAPTLLAMVAQAACIGVCSRV